MHRTLLFGLGICLATSVIAQTVTTLTSESFEASGDLAVAQNGDIYVANFGTFLNNANGAEVYRVSPLGEVSVFATGLSGASGNTFASDGTLYQSSIAANRVSAIAPDGTVSTFLTGVAGVRNPVGLTFDGAQNLYVANCGDNTILRANPDGTTTTFSNSPLLSCPNGLTSDSNDNLYAANFNNGNIVKVAPDGSASVLASTPAGTTKPTGGNGHIIYGNDRLYVVSNATHQVFELSLEGELSLLAGTGERGRADGPALESSFALPNGIGLSPDGNTLYVNDSEDLTSDNNIAPNVVRAVSLRPEIPINAGLSGAWYNPDTAGQGMLFDVNTDIDVFFVAWFTFEAESKIGVPEQRWLSAQGPSSGSRAVLDLRSTQGGVFDVPGPTQTSVIGTLEMVFHSCSEATATYTFNEGGRSGSITLVRLTPDVFCEGQR